MEPITVISFMNSNNEMTIHNSHDLEIFREIFSKLIFISFVLTSKVGSE